MQQYDASYPTRGGPDSAAYNAAGNAAGAAAYDVAAAAGRGAASALNAGTRELNDYVQKGADALAILSFLANLLVFVCAAIGILSIGGLIFSPIHYIVNIYQIFFASCGMALESQDKWVEQVEQIAQAQKYIFQYAKFLTKLWGRGVLYIFEASLAMTHGALMYNVVGAIMLVVGVVTVVSEFYPEAGKKAVNSGLGGVQAATGQYAAKYERVPAPNMR
jgi:hypothetical protein